MSLAAKIQIEHTLVQGYVYYFAEDSFESDDPHYCVVLNKNLRKNQLLLFAVATSRIKKTEAIRSALMHPPETYVKVSPQECSFLKRETIFNCNELLAKTKKELEVLVTKRKLKFVGEASAKVMLKILYGIFKSPVLLEQEKEYILGED